MTFHVQVLKWKMVSIVFRNTGSNCKPSISISYHSIVRQYHLDLLQFVSFSLLWLTSLCRVSFVFQTANQG
jgi:hypothetical protein